MGSFYMIASVYHFWNETLKFMILFFVSGKLDLLYDYAEYRQILR